MVSGNATKMTEYYTTEELFGSTEEKEKESYSTDELFNPQYDEYMSAFERGAAKRAEGGLRQELMSGVDRFTAEWIREVADAAGGLDKVAQWISEKTGLESGGLFGKAAETWTNQAEYLRGRGRQDFLGDILAGLGGAPPTIAEITALGGGAPGMILHGGLKGAQHGGIQGAVTGAVAGGLTHGSLGAIGQLPRSLQGLASMTFGGMTAAGKRPPENFWELLVGTASPEERFKGGFSWYLLNKTGGGRKVPFSEFIDRYPTLDKATKEVNARYMLGKLEKTGLLDDVGINKSEYSKLKKSDDKIEYIDSHLRGAADYRAAPEEYGTVRQIKNRFTDQSVGDRPTQEFKQQNFTTNPVTPTSYRMFHSGLPLPEKFVNAGQRFLDKFQVERVFDRLGFNDTGRALKLIHTREKMYQDIGHEDVREFAKEYGDMSNSERQDLYFLIGKKKIPVEKEFRFKDPHQFWTQKFDEWQARLQEKDIPADWPNSAIERAKERMAEVNEQFGHTRSTEKLAKLNDEMDSLEKEIRFLSDNNVRYNPITRQMIQGFYEKNPGTAGARMTEFYQNRKTYDTEKLVKWLIEKGEIEPKDTDIVTVYTSYVNSAAKKLAIADAFQAAKREGALARKGEVEGYKSLPVREFPSLRKFEGHPEFVDYLTKNFVKENFMPMDINKWLGRIKMLQFYNPAFLPMYDIKQAFWAGTLTSKHLPQAIRDAVVMKKNKNAGYWDALYWGLTSTPFSPDFESYHENNKLLLERSPLARHAKKHIRAPLYRLSWEAAWKIDHFIRLVTYNKYRAQGLSPRDAAYNAARIHGDYASVPPAMRRHLNRIFFTPTFKIAMVAAQTEMFSEAAKQLTYASGISKDKPSKRQAHMARATIGLLSAIALREATFKILGFTSDQFGLKYKKEYIDENGERREMVVHAASPDNVILRYFHRFKSLPTEPDKVLGFMNRLKWDLNPLYQFGHELFTNQGMDFTPIYNNFDDTPDIIYDIGKYTIKRLLPITSLIPGMGSAERQRTFHYLKNDLGVMADALRPFTLQYTRNNAEARANWKMHDLIRRFKEESKKDPPRTDKEAIERVQKLEKMLRKLQNEMESKSFDSPYRDNPRKSKDTYSTGELFK